MSNLAKLISNLLALLLFFAGLISFLWIFFGTLPGIILFIMALTTSEADKKKKYFKWTIVCFGGIGLLLLTIALFAIFLLLGTVFGVNIFGLHSQQPYMQ